MRDLPSAVQPPRALGQGDVPATGREQAAEGTGPGPLPDTDPSQGSGSRLDSVGGNVEPLEKEEANESSISKVEALPVPFSRATLPLDQGLF